MITVVLPAYNEETGLARLFERLVETRDQLGQALSVVVVDDGSTDGTADVVRSWQTRLPVTLLQNARNSGLSATLGVGLQHALSGAGETDIIVTMDADDTQHPNLIPRMESLINSGRDIVIASRYVPGASISGLSWHRKLFSIGAGTLFRVLLPMGPVRDYTCGYRAYRAGFLKPVTDANPQVFAPATGFACMVDLLLTCRRFRPSCAEVPLTLRYDLKVGASKMRVLRTIRESLRLLLKHLLHQS